MYIAIGTFLHTYICIFQANAYYVYVHVHIMYILECMSYICIYSTYCFIPCFILCCVYQLGYGDLGSYGGATESTPNIDQMASEGLRFLDFYAASPVCSPSRYAMILCVLMYSELHVHMYVRNSCILVYYILCVY